MNGIREALGEIVYNTKTQTKMLLLKINDDCAGFGSSEFSGKYGINNKYRIKKWVGEVHIQSEKGKGTSVLVSIPFQKNITLKDDIRQISLLLILKDAGKYYYII